MSDPALLSAEDERALTAELAWNAVSVTAPDELSIFEETAADYFADPQRSLSAARGDEAVGFGLELALVTPTVLAVAAAALHALGAIVSDAFKSEGQPVARRLIRRLFRLPDRDSHPAESAPPPLSVEQARHVRSAAYNRAVALGMSHPEAGILADAIAGRLLVA
jgi:hypothetical protein